MTRHILRIELTASAKEKLSTLSKSRGMTQVAVLSRLVEWFASAPESIQGGILGHYPESLKGEILRLIVEEMSKDSHSRKKDKP